MGSYVPNTKEQQAQMLEAIGLNSLEELFVDIPKEMFLKDGPDIPPGRSELEVRRYIEALAEKNTVFKTVLRGAGAYSHYIPSMVKSVVSKDEFITAYTPYQAEISQGILQAIFEYQTMICMLTGMDASNASVYDGSTAAAEALAMCRDRKRHKALVSACVNPQVLETMRTYSFGSGAELMIVPQKDGKTDLGALSELLDGETASFYMQQPNFFGQIEDARALGDIVHQAGAKFIMGVNPIAMALLKTPGECGADIAVGEGQPLGMPLSFGGPYLGFMACKEKLVRNLPGRIVGETTDVNGQRAYVLTLQAREQHIRREKASSNICSNQALCALTASVYLSVVGPRGLQEVAEQCVSKAHYAAEKLAEIPGFSLRHKGEFFHEFMTDCPVDPALLNEKLADEGILGPLPHEGGLLWCVTEMSTKAEIDRAIEIAKEAAQ